MTAERILLIEDEPSIADSVLYALQTEGFATELCKTAAAARVSLEQEAPALILLDIGLPDGNGFELARELRRSSDVPIIFVTARSEEIDRIVGLEIGADDYVVKPFSPRELTARVKAVLRRTQTPASPETSPVPSTHGAFTLDELKFSIAFRGEPLELSRYEFRLLAVLIKRPGQVYSREQLMQIAWEEPDMSLERTVDTHIKTLRQKLRRISPNEEMISTHRGIGYSIKETQPPADDDGTRR